MYISASAPDAPPLSETTIGCFIRLFFWMAACIMRAIWSEAPPAPAATTISTGLVGSHAASAAGDMIAPSRATPAAAFLAWLMQHLLQLMMSLPCGNQAHAARRCAVVVFVCAA